MRRRGNALLTTLVWIALIVALAFGLAGLTVSHLSTVTYQDNRQAATLLARSAVSTALAKLMYDTDYGTKDKPSGLLTVSQPEGTGYLSFERAEANRQGIPYSTNNLEETTSVQGAGGHSVPSNSVRLIGVGQAGGITQSVECILSVPPFPYAIAASGAVEARGGLVIGSLKELFSGSVPADAKLLPADLLANATGDQAVFLGQNTKISGDVRAGGGIVLDPAAPPDSIEVKGQLRAHSGGEKIPAIDLAHYDPRINGNAFANLTQPEYGDGQTKLGGISRREGDLLVKEGLFLDGGVLYVHGNLTVHGGLTGKGIVVADGNITLDGQSNFDATGGVALLAARDLSISGSSPSGSYFQGLLYTEGGFIADKVTLIGCLIAGGDPNDVKLTDCRVLQPPSASASPAAPPPPAASAPAGGDFQQSTVTQDGAQNVVFKVQGQTLTLERRSYANPPEAGSLVDSTSFSFTNWAEFYETDPRVYDWCMARNVSRSNIAGVLTWFDGRLPPPSASGSPSLGASPSAGPAIALLDPSSFLKLNERIRIVMWKEE